MKPIRRKDSSPGRSLPGLEGEGRLSRSGFLSQNRSRDLAESVGHPEKAQVGLPVFGRMRAIHDRLAVRWIAKNLRASVRRHRRAQGGSPTLRSIRPKRAALGRWPGGVFFRTSPA